MLKRGRSDWFPIVATDLFCSVLAAVIILDASAPKYDLQSQSEPALVTLAYEKGLLANCNDLTRIAFAIKVRSRTFNSIADGRGVSTDNDGTCLLQYAFPKLARDDWPREALIGIADYPGRPTITVIRHGFAPIRCLAPEGKSAFICSN